MKARKGRAIATIVTSVGLFLATGLLRAETEPARPRVIGPDEAGYVFVAPHAEFRSKVGSVSTGSSQLFMAIATYVPGGETPTHLHEIDEELLYVLDGEVTVTLDDQEHTVGPGGTVIVPPGTWMAIANRTESPAVVMGVLPRGELEEVFRVLLSEDADETALREAQEIPRVIYRPATSDE